MDLITTTSELAAVCARLAKHPVITVDTEFRRRPTSAAAPDGERG
jgi:ribonuclease D